MELTAQSQEIQEVTQQTGDIMEKAKGVVVVDDAGVESASIILKTISDAKKSIEDRRTFFVKPLNDQVKKINDLFKTIATPLSVADSLIRGKILTYRTKQQEALRKEQERLDAQARKEQKKADAKAERMGVESVTITAPVVAPPPTTIGNATVKKVWKFKVVDPTIVPRDYMAVDETKIRAAVRDGIRSIQGVEIFQEDQLSIGGRS